jgi:hypothetical protein
MAELLRAILRSAVDVALVGWQIDPEPSGRESGRLPRREPLCCDRHVEQFNSYKFTRLYRLSKEAFANIVTLIDPHLRRSPLTATRLRCSSRPAGHDGRDSEIPRGRKDTGFGLAVWPWRLNSLCCHRRDDGCNRHCAAEHNLPVDSRRCRERSRRVAAISRVHVVRHYLCPRWLCCGNPLSYRCRCSNPTSYYNRKGFYATCVQAAVLANEKVFFLSTKHAGTTHDSTVFGTTALHAYLLKTEPEGWLPEWATGAANNAYVNGSAGGRILTSYSGSLTSIQDSFNYFLSSLRIMVEQAFGVVVARWGIIWSPLHSSLAKVSKIIVVCCKLHNFIIDQRGKGGITAGVPCVPAVDPGQPHPRAGPGVCARRSTPQFRSESARATRTLRAAGEHCQPVARPRSETTH